MGIISWEAITHLCIFILYPQLSGLVHQTWVWSALFRSPASYSRPLSFCWVNCLLILNCTTEASLPPSALGWCLRCLHFLCGILYKSCFPGRYRTYYGNDHTGIGEDDSCSLPSRSRQMCVLLCFLDVQTFLKLLITGWGCTLGARRLLGTWNILGSRLLSEKKT